MTVTITSELEAQVRDRARIEGPSIEAYIERLILEEDWWQEQEGKVLDRREPEFAGIHAAVDEGMRDAERGETRPASEVFAELRSKYGISG